ncbi:MAG: LuxR family transcriptional regulator [Deltaproteobacteria bacterium]|nr:LuxR family transcriptional regulator [Deltaproteobacteria bacterium]
MENKSISYRNLIRDIVAANSIEALENIGQAIAIGFGFNCFSYGTAIPITPSQPRVLIIHSYPDSWWNTYLSKNLLAKDPFLAYCLENTVPIEWTTEESTLGKLDKKKVVYSDFLRLARDAGFTGGISVPIHGAVGEVGMFTVTSDCFDPEQLNAILFQNFPQIVLLGVFFHDQAKKVLKNKSEGKKDPLTLREKECLFWAAEGKTSGETASILNISERTVTFHLSNVIKKLNVSSRQHAIGQASATKLLLNILPLIPTIQESLKKHYSSQKPRGPFSSKETLRP